MKQATIRVGAVVRLGAGAGVILAVTGDAVTVRSCGVEHVVELAAVAKAGGLTVGLPRPGR